jgi:hypothetical protein
MTANGQPPGTRSLHQRLDPARVAQLEQNDRMQSALLVNRALGDVSNLANALEFLVQAANGGNATARSVLSLLFANLDTARAASAGIALPPGARAGGP